VSLSNALINFTDVLEFGRTHIVFSAVTGFPAEADSASSMKLGRVSIEDGSSFCDSSN
jgi:hypothetical protein